ncbi:MAG TPA: hypothetical protein VL614_14980 [Acetobacteraceae bacterium]|jgi:hypothetical protein|nr:hypothetical protein [Acetobacteraceae bacterium]
MFIRYRFRDMILRDADDGGGSGGGGTTVAGGGSTVAGGGQQHQQHQQQPNNGGGGDGGRAQQTLAEVRAEAAAQRVARQQAQERADTLARDLETTRADVPRLIAEEAAKHTPKITKLQGTLINAELKAAAVGAGLADLDLLHLPALDRSKIKVDDDGNVTGVEEALTEFKAKKPEYFKGASTVAGGGSTVAGGGGTVTGAGGSTVVGGGSGRPTVTGSAANPPPATGTGAVDVKGMTKEQYAQYKAGMDRRLRGR